MANVRSANTFYIDSQASSSSATVSSNLAVKNIKLVGAVFTATAAGSVTLSDVTTDNKKLSLALAAAGSVQVEFLNTAMIFPNGISPTTLTTGSVSCIIEETRS